MDVRGVLGKDEVLGRQGGCPAVLASPRRSRGLGSGRRDINAAEAPGGQRDGWVTASRECCKWSPYRLIEKVSK